MSFTFDGSRRPTFAEEPGPGQESVWDFPRPPRVEPVERRIRVEVEGVEVASTERALRVVETAGAPVYYIPPDDVRIDLLRPNEASSFCEWKGRARYFDLEVDGREIQKAGWTYPDPHEGFGEIQGHLAFYAGKVDAAWVGDEKARPQPGGFYGGWMTDDLAGPVKGEPGSQGW